MKINLMKVGMTTIGLSLMGLLFGATIVVLTTCFRIVKWVVIKLFRIIF